MHSERDIGTRLKYLASTHWVMFFACLVLIATRSWPRLAHAHLWAEDGAVFFPDAIEFGFSSIWRPHAGYYQLFPRVVAYVSSLFHFRHFARLINAASFMLFAFAASTFSRRAYRGIVSSDILRMAVCLSICGAPGLFEVLGNLANTHNILIVFVGLLMLRPLGTSLSLIDWTVFIFAFGSDGACCVWIPSMLVRVFLTTDKTRTLDDLLSMAIAFTWVVLHVQALHQDQAFTTSLPQARDLLSGMFFVASERLFVLPLVGKESASYAMQHKEWLCAAYIPLALAFVTIFRHHKSLALLIATVVSTPLGVYVATWITRTGSLDSFLAGNMFFYSVRYAFVMAPFALVLWACAFDSSFRQADFQNRHVVAFATCLSMLSLSPWEGFFLGLPNGARTDWRASALKMEAARQTESCEELSFPCDPSGWEVVYRPPRGRCASKSAKRGP